MAFRNRLVPKEQHCARGSLFDPSPSIIMPKVSPRHVVAVMTEAAKLPVILPVARIATTMDVRIVGWPACAALLTDAGLRKLGLQILVEIVIADRVASPLAVVLAVTDRWRRCCRRAGEMPLHESHGFTFAVSASSFGGDRGRLPAAALTSLRRKLHLRNAAVPQVMPVREPGCHAVADPSGHRLAAAAVAQLC